MPHIEKLMKIRVPNLPCQAILKKKSYPLYFLSESPEIIDLLFADQRIMEFFTKSSNELLWKNILTIHMTDQNLYSKFDYEIKANIGIEAN